MGKGYPCIWQRSEFGSASQKSYIVNDVTHTLLYENLILSIREPALTRSKPALRAPCGRSAPRSRWACRRPRQKMRCDLLPSFRSGQAARGTVEDLVIATERTGKKI